jgi:hypothetical protein
MDDDAFPPSMTAVVSDDDLEGSSCSETFDDWCSKSFAETAFAATTLLPAGSAFVVVVVVFLAGVFASDEEFELPHAIFQFIDGTRAAGTIFVFVEFICGIGFGLGRTFIEGVFVLVACGAGM